MDLRELFDEICADISFWKSARARKKEDVKRIEGYKTMLPHQLYSMSDIEMLYAVITRMNCAFETDKDFMKGFEKLTRAQKILYLLDIYEQCINEGGILFLLSDINRGIASMIPWALSTAGAETHAELLVDFLDKTKIDLRDLSEFELPKKQSKKEKARFTKEKREKYPIEEFDKAYSALAPLGDDTTVFIRDFILEL